MVSYIFGTTVWGSSECPVKPKGRAKESFLKIKLSAIKISTFIAKYLASSRGSEKLIFLLLGINLFVGQINSRILCNHMLTDLPFCPFTK